MGDFCGFYEFGVSLLLDAYVGKFLIDCRRGLGFFTIDYHWRLSSLLGHSHCVRIRPYSKFDFWIWLQCLTSCRNLNSEVAFSAWAFWSSFFFSNCESLSKLACKMGQNGMVVFSAFRFSSLTFSISTFDKLQDLSTFAKFLIFQYFCTVAEVTMLAAWHLTSYSIFPLSWSFSFFNTFARKRSYIFESRLSVAFVSSFSKSVKKCMSLEKSHIKRFRIEKIKRFLLTGDYG